MKADPYEHMTIDREAFVKKYGKAGEQFVASIKQEGEVEALKVVRGFFRDGVYFIEIAQQVLGYIDGKLREASKA